MCGTLLMVLRIGIYCGGEELSREKLIYTYEQTPPLSVTIFAGLQWFIVALSSSLVVPLVIGDAFQLNQDEIAVFVQRTFFFVGVASLLQVLFGHRLPIIEGPAGMWWGIFLIMAQVGTSLGKTPDEIGRNLQFGLIVAGIVLVLIGIFRLVEKIRRIFTPMVTGTYMILLAVSLSGSFLKGILGIGYFDPYVHTGIAIVSLLLLSFTFFLVISRWKWARSYSLLIGMIVGWLIYLILDWTSFPELDRIRLYDVPGFFFWGAPSFDPGITITSVLTGLILLTNLVASIVVMLRAANHRPDEQIYNRGGTYTGIAHILSGVGGVVGLVPLSIAAGVVETTRIASRSPFILASLLMMAMGFFPVIGAIFSGLPAPVGYAVLFVSFTQLLGFGVKDLSLVKWDRDNVLIVGSSLLMGCGLMFVPGEALAKLPQLLAFLVGNGFMVGVLTCILLEQIVFRRQKKGNSTEKAVDVGKV